MDRTRAERFFTDARVLKAREMIQEALVDHQTDLSGISPPLSDLKKSYEETLENLYRLRGADLFYPYLGSGFGRGVLVELADGSVKYDLITGIGAHFFGHSQPELIDASICGALEDVVMQGHLQQNLESVKLVEQFVRLSGLDHCFLTTSGAMANENALKIAFQFNHSKNRVMVFEHCFMGRTLALAQMTDKAAYREGLPLNMGIDYIPFFDHRDPEGSTRRAVDAMETLIHRYPEMHAVMVFELIQGEGGYNTAPREFFTALMAVCRAHGIAVMVDEIQTFGRTERPFAFQTLELEEYTDLVTVGKMTQVCATLFRKRVKPKGGLLSQTFTAPSAVIRAAIAILERIENGDLYGKNGRIAHRSTTFRNHLEELSRRYPNYVRGPFGMGAMIAFTPMDGELKTAIALVKTLFNEGVIAFIGGAVPARIRFLIPACVIQEGEIDEVMKIIERTLVKFAEKLSV